MARVGARATNNGFTGTQFCRSVRSFISFSLTNSARSERGIPRQCNCICPERGNNSGDPPTVAQMAETVRRCSLFRSAEHVIIYLQARRIADTVPKDTEASTEACRTYCSKTNGPRLEK
jgi:hypothetical protein